MRWLAVVYLDVSQQLKISSCRIPGRLVYTSRQAPLGQRRIGDEGRLPTAAPPLLIDPWALGLQRRCSTTACLCSRLSDTTVAMAGAVLVTTLWGDGSNILVFGRVAAVVQRACGGWSARAKPSKRRDRHDELPFPYGLRNHAGSLALCSHLRILCRRGQGQDSVVLLMHFAEGHRTTR